MRRRCACSESHAALSSRTTFGNSQHNVHSVKEGSLFWAENPARTGHAPAWMCLSSNGLGLAVRRLTWTAEPPMYVSQGCGYCGTLGTSGLWSPLASTQITHGTACFRDTRWGPAAENELANMFAVAKAFAHQAAVAGSGNDSQQSELLVIPFQSIARITVGQRCANPAEHRKHSQVRRLTL